MDDEQMYGGKDDPPFSSINCKSCSACAAADVSSVKSNSMLCIVLCESSFCH